MFVTSFFQSNPADRLRKIEEFRKKLDSSYDEYESYTLRHMSFNRFSEWADQMRNVDDADKARTILYYGFQPVFDLIINHDVSFTKRPLAIRALNDIVQSGVSYLTGYYTGEPQIAILNKLGKTLHPAMVELDEFRLRTKDRNVDRNGIYPSCIRSFLRQFSDFSLDGKLFVPDTIVGCACGSSEIVMPLAGMHLANTVFIRRSHRRGDEDPKMIPEQKEEIESYTKGKRVVCVEDYVCTGESLKKVMDLIKLNSPAELMGTSVNYSGNRYLNRIHESKKFHLYTL